MIPEGGQPETVPSSQQQSLPSLSFLTDYRQTTTTTNSRASNPAVESFAQQHPGLLPIQPASPASSVRPLPPIPVPARKPQARPSKRQKISLACHECRLRKTKCDGARPICGSCAKKKLSPEACHYEPERGRRGVKSQYVQMLEDRVRELERAGQIHNNNNNNNTERERSSSISSNTEPVPLLFSSWTKSAPKSAKCLTQKTDGTQNLALMQDAISSSTPTSQNIPASTSPSSQAPSSMQTIPPSASTSSQTTTVSLLPSSQSISSNIQPAHTTHQSPSSSRGPPSIHSLHSDPASVHSFASARNNNPASIHTDGPGSPTTVREDLHATVGERKQDDSNRDEEDQVQVDAMGAVNNSDSRNQDDGDNDRHGYFGSSSGLSFMKEVREVIGKKTASSPEATSSISRSESLFGGGGSERTSSFSRGSRATTRGHYRGMLNDYVLPPRKVADGLVKTYWNLVHCLYPFLHRPSFMRIYARLWNNSEEEEEDRQGGADEQLETDPLFHCILNLVFALGCQLSPEINELEREPASDVFFQRSKKLLHFDILEEGNIMVVQALLLMGQYLQCTNMPGRCWLVVGLAIRVAQGLGLHLDGHGDRPRSIDNGHRCSQLDKELKKRLWGGCIVLDRFISMAYGRPFMIPVSQQPALPQVIDDDLLTTAPNPPAVQPEDKPSHMAFFVHTIRLYEIMGDILNTIYSGGTRRSVGNMNTPEEGGLNAVIRLQSALSTWERTLPWFLKPSGLASLTDNAIIRQNNVLRARFLHTCILLYRPLFAYFFASEESGHGNLEESTSANMGLQKSVYINCSTVCVRVAQELVDLIRHTNQKSLHLPAWWYNIFYLYTAATVLLMARLFPRIKEEIGEKSLADSWDKCLNCLLEYQAYHKTAKWCYKSLRDLDNLAFQRDSDNPTFAMSGIQILNTLPNHTSTMAQAVPDTNNSTNRSRENEGVSAMNPSQMPSVDQNIADWEIDLQDMSWLGRLPVYTDLEPGFQANQWLGSFYGDGNPI